MQNAKTLLTCLFLALSLIALPACEKKPSPPAGGTGAKVDDHGHAHGPDGEHKDASAEGHHSGKVIDLGSAQIGSFDVKATRDAGQIVAGKDAPIDATVVPAAGSTAEATAVRFWIGVEDAKGSVKAKADIEDPKEPNRWHTHAEIPDPIPAGGKLWVEIETEAGETVFGSFELKS